MSRSVKGSKGSGYDFWTRRPFNKHGANGYGPYAKKRTHRAERAEGKDAVRKALDE